MKKIPTIFVRNASHPELVTGEINRQCQWVFDGEGRATRKFDGTAVLIEGGIMYKRYDCRRGKVPPAGFRAADDPDPITGHWPGWVIVDPKDGEFHWYRDAFAAYGSIPPDGTYELLHPRFQGRDSSHINPEHVEGPMFVRHGAAGAHHPVPIMFETMRSYFNSLDWEGIVWHHPDGRMAKIKARDFGVKRI